MRADFGRGGFYALGARPIPGAIGPDRPQYESLLNELVSGLDATGEGRLKWGVSSSLFFGRVRSLLIVPALLAACSDETDPPGGGGSGASGGGNQGGEGAATTNDGGGGTTSNQAGGTSDGGMAAGGGGASGTNCPDVLTCSAPYPNLGDARDWIHTSSSFTAAAFDNHRGRDMFYNPGDEIWVMAKFAYGVFDDDIQDEDVDVYLNRDCGGSWEALGTFRTTDDGEHPTVEGVEDTGGWIYYKLPDELALGVGRHRFLMAVGGDLTTTEVYVDIVAAGTPIVVSDVDGTLTTTETEEFSALLTGDLPGSNPDSANVLQGLADKGYRVFYMTARPHFLHGRTREFLDAYQYPLGLVHTTLSLTGATGSSAVEYKSGELAAIAARGLVPTWAFGNTDSDAEAYDVSSIEPSEHRVMYQFTDEVHNSRRIEAYAELLPEVSASDAAVCP